MSDYQRPSDQALAKDLVQLAPTEAAGFLALKNASERDDGVIPPKYRELMSIAVAVTSQCAYCIDVHTRRAAAVGASREKIAEAVFVAAALRAGATVGHGLLAVRLFDQACSGKSG